MKTINLEEILFKDSGMEKFKKDFPKTYQTILIGMKEACKQVLELAAENAFAYTELSETAYIEGSYDTIIDKKSILDTLDQVE